jgi:hypothetical protein
MRLACGFDAHNGVGDGYRCVAVGHGRCRVQYASPSIDAGHGIRRVAHEVEDYLLELDPIGFDFRH